MIKFWFESIQQLVGQKIKEVMLMCIVVAVVKP